MNAWNRNPTLKRGRMHGSARPTWAPPASALHMVMPAELEQLRTELLRGHVPRDLELKLQQLLDGGLMHQSLGHSCLWFLAVLQAAFDGAYRMATPEQIDFMLRVLAYVRKDDDAIHDLQPNGYTDDHQEARIASTRLQPLLLGFKQWRLRHVVPVLWHGAA